MNQTHPVRAPYLLSSADQIEHTTNLLQAETPATPGDQTDGAPAELGGSDLQEPEYTVEVKLSDLQADPNNPLYSVKNFDDLGL